MKQTWAFAAVMVAIGIIVGSGLTHGYDLQRAHDYGRALSGVCRISQNGISTCTFDRADDGMTVDLPWLTWLKIVAVSFVAMLFLVPIMSVWCGWSARIDYMKELAWQREVERQQREASDEDGKS